MATIRRFEDLDCWQAGRALKQQIYRLTRKQEFSRDLPLVSQIRRAASSVTSNIAEGFERDGNREFVSFLSISKGSCGEVKDHLYTAFDERYIAENEFENTYKLADEAGRRIGAFMRYLEQSDLKGRKFANRPRSSTTRNPEP